HVSQLFERGALGLDATLRAIVEGRLQMLVYADGFASHGGECPRCRALLGFGPPAPCAYCGTDLLPVDDLVGRAAARALAAGASVEGVQGEPAARLLEAGGMGGVLGY